MQDRLANEYEAATQPVPEEIVRTDTLIRRDLIILGSCRF